MLKELCMLIKNLLIYRHRQKVNKTSYVRSIGMK